MRVFFFKFSCLHGSPRKGMHSSYVVHGNLQVKPTSAFSLRKKQLQ